MHYALVHTLAQYLHVCVCEQKTSIGSELTIYLWGIASDY